jgi:hypothetical protein
VTVWHDLQEDPGRGGAVLPVREGAAGPPDATGAGFDLSFFATLSGHLGSLADSFKREQDRRDVQAACAPQDYQYSVSATMGSTGILYLDLGAVPQGRVWQVRRLVLGGPAANDAPTGKALIFAQGSKPVALTTSNLVDSFPSFAAGAQGSTYGTHQLFLVSPLHLWAVIVTGATGTQWTASVTVEDFDADTYYQAAAELAE